jgi:hypothetical protein
MTSPQLCAFAGSAEAVIKATTHNAVTRQSWPNLRHTAFIPISFPSPAKKAKALTHYITREPRAAIDPMPDFVL